MEIQLRNNYDMGNRSVYYNARMFYVPAWVQPKIPHNDIA
ncbi:hypothetical protein [Heliorestis convoluta]